MTQNLIMKGWKEKMIKCKIADGANCGKVICCATCEEHLTCEECCPDIKSGDISNPTDECEEAEALAEEMIDLNTQVPDVIKAITDICVQKKALEEQEKAMKKQLQEAMEQYGVKKFENEAVAFTYVAPTTRTSIDSARLKKEHPDIAEQYSKTSNVSASVRINVKG